MLVIKRLQRLQRLERLDRSQAFGLIEVLLTAAMFAIFASALITLSASSAKQIVVDKHRRVAALLAKDGAEKVKNINYTNLVNIQLWNKDLPPTGGSNPYEIDYGTASYNGAIKVWKLINVGSLLDGDDSKEVIYVKDDAQPAVIKDNFNGDNTTTTLEPYMKYYRTVESSSCSADGSCLRFSVKVEWEDFNRTMISNPYSTIDTIYITDHPLTEPTPV